MLYLLRLAVLIRSLFSRSIVWRSYKEGSSVLEHVVAHFGFARFRNFCRLTAMASSQPQKR